MVKQVSLVFFRQKRQGFGVKFKLRQLLLFTLTSEKDSKLPPQYSFLRSCQQLSITVMINVTYNAYVRNTLHIVSLLRILQI